MSDTHDTRRDFLQHAGCLALALGLPRAIWALPITTVSGQGTGSTKIYPLPAADAVQIDYDAQVIIVRSQNHVFAFNLSCPHEHAAVKWVAKDGRFQCTRHDSKYQPDGVYMAGRATRNMDRLAIRREGPSVVVDLDHMVQSDKDPAGWAAAAISVQ